MGSAIVEPMRLLRKLMMGAAAVSLAGLAGGCGGPNFSDICGSRESCLGGNDKDTAACADEYKTEQTTADDLGCESEFNDAVTCVANASTCRTKPGGPCNVDADCAKQSGGTCVAKQCAIKGWGMDSNDTSCDSVKAAYSECKQ